MTDTKNEKSEWSEREIGALWKREGRNQKYLTGKLKSPDGSEQQVVIFSNKNKTKDNQPDFRVYKSLDKPVTVDDGVDEASTDVASADEATEQEDLL